MQVTGGRVPGHYSTRLVVTEESNDKIVVEDRNPTSKSGFIMTVLKTVPADTINHALDDGEQEVRCMMQWNGADGLVVISGEAHLRNDGSIRCDSMDCLEFWMEMRSL